MSREIAILGGHPHSATDGSDLPERVELWCANETHRGLVREPARVFQLHPPHWREEERLFLNGGVLPKGVDEGCFGRNTEHLDYLASIGERAIVQSVLVRDRLRARCLLNGARAGIPLPTVYPFEPVTEAVGIPLPPHGRKRFWATSTFGYMLALAITEHTEFEGAGYRGASRPEYIARIHIYGVELPLGSQRERLWEWPNLAYYLGLARGLGIEIVLPENGTSLLSAPHYALDSHPQVGDCDHWWMPGKADVIQDIEEGVYRLG